MSVKKKLGMGIAGAVLSVGLIGGGTFAYFSDEAEQNNSFTSGTIDLGVEPEVAVDLDKLKPGDWIPRSFDLENSGTLDMGKVDLNTDYEVSKNGTPVREDLADKYADQIMVEFLNNTSGEEDNEILFQVSLKDLRDKTPEDLATKINMEKVKIADGYKKWIPFVGWVVVDPIYKDKQEKVTGIKAGETANFDVQFRFNNTEEEQNELQDLDLDLNWTFEARQTDGEER